MNETVKIEPFAADDAPTMGARRVWWLVGDKWQHKGWLMPPIFTNERTKDDQST